MAFEDAPILLILIPGEVAGRSVRNASDPITGWARWLYFLARRRAAITSPSVRVNARVARVVQGAQGGPRRQRPEAHLPSVVVKARGKGQPLVPKNLDRLVGGAATGKGLEKVGEHFPHLRVGVISSPCSRSRLP
jgi:hypothetical protein